MSERPKPRDDLFVDAYGVTTHFHHWPATTPARGVVQIAHGLGEHALRYRHVAETLQDAGFEVWANHHRGHGLTGREQWAGTPEKMGRLGPGGLPATVRAIRDFTTHIRGQQPELPLAFLGHSWGSLMGQMLLNKGYANEVDAVVLTGTTYRMPGYMNAGDLNAKHRHLGTTGAEWLSRDVAVHQAWLDDPDTFPAKTLQLFGLIDSARLLGRPRPVSRDIPLLMMVGDDDSLGGRRGVEALEQAYRSRGGLTRISTKIYPGARHEVFNETNRDEVLRDLIDWLDQNLLTPRP